MTVEHLLPDILRCRARVDPLGPAYRFVDALDTEETYDNAELWRRVADIGATLESNELRGRPVLLLFPPGLDYVAALWACFVSGAIAVPAYPPSPVALARTTRRLANIAANAEIAAVVTTRAVRSLAHPVLKAEPGFPSALWLDEFDWLDGARWKPPDLAADDIALYQYTSGSTGDPKGVVITHGDLIANSAMIAELYGSTEELHAVMWLPPYHDMGLVGALLQPIYAGGQATLMSPDGFIADPMQWLRLMSRYRGTIGAAPNFAYDLVVRKCRDADLVGLDLSSWRVAINGAERVDASTIDRFAERFSTVGLDPNVMVPSYGLAEATLVVTATEPGTAPRRVVADRGELDAGRLVERLDASLPVRTVVSSGRPPGGVDVCIVDESQQTLPEGAIGEIWVRGSSIATAYVGRPDLSERLLHARSDAGVDGGTWLRTGDVGCLDGGELFVLGRSKDLIIVRGLNLHPDDIEQAVAGSHPLLRPGGVVAYPADDQGRETIGVAAEVRSDQEQVEGEFVDVLHAIRLAIARAVGISPGAVAIVPPRSLPKTSSGKPMRSATARSLEVGEIQILEQFRAGDTIERPALEFDDLVAMAPPERTMALTELVWTYMRRLNLDLVRRPEANENFDDLGVDSLSRYDLIGRLEAHFDRHVTVGTFNTMSIASLVDAMLVLLEEECGRVPAPMLP